MSLEDLVTKLQCVKAEKKELAKVLEGYDALKVQYDVVDSQCKELSLKIKGMLDV